MRITLSLPDRLARRLLAAVPVRQRLALVARLIEQELGRVEKTLEHACLAANRDGALASETIEWQRLDDAVPI